MKNKIQTKPRRVPVKKATICKMYNDIGSLLDSIHQLPTAAKALANDVKPAPPSLQIFR